MMSMRQTMRECVRRLPTVGFYLHLANCLLSTYITIKSIIRTNEHHTRSIWISGVWNNRKCLIKVRLSSLTVGVGERVGVKIFQRCNRKSTKTSKLKV